MMRNFYRRFILSVLIFLSVFSVSAKSDAVPGVVINHVSATNKAYIGSPSIAVLPNGNYVVSHDLFGPGSTRNKTLVFLSSDKGTTWKQISELTSQWWSTIFVHHTNLYLLGTSAEYGFVVIRRSADSGKTWTEPKDAHTGLLLGDGRYHCAPVPVIVHNGRIWRAMEDAMGGGGWGKHFQAFMMSAPENADLLDAASWTFSNRLARDEHWLDGSFAGWLEGNAVALLDGTMTDILRVASTNYPERVAVIKISNDGKHASFDPESGFIEFPGGAKKFTIRFDPVTKYYWSLANVVPEEFQNSLPDKTRNTLALIRSKDCLHWETRQTLIRNKDVKKHGYQYVDWLFDGDDLIAVVRTAHDDSFGGANNYHNSNYITFLRVKDFRKSP